MIVIDERRLTPVAKVDAGSAQTVTYATWADSRLTAELVFKAPRADLGTAFDQRLVDRMRKVVGRRDTMSPRDTELDGLTTWPLTTAARNDRFMGYLARIVDRDHLFIGRVLHLAERLGGRPR